MPYHKQLFILSAAFFAISIFLSPPPAESHTDILIIAPHPDDAVLCCAGLIQQSLAQGKSIRVIDITDGDGYREAAAILAKKSAAAVTASDMLRLGRMRRKEEVQALGILGVSRKNIQFLGYPDGWLDEVYNAGASSPFTSPNTGEQRNSTGKYFTKQAMVSDMTSLLIRLKPQEIYVTGVADTALDHQVAYRIMMDAINEAGYTGKLFTYIIHSEEIVGAIHSPSATINLTRDELLVKNSAIKKYKTQMVPDGEYLSSFVRNTEVFY